MRAGKGGGMLRQTCENCGVRQSLSPPLWKRVFYHGSPGSGTTGRWKIVCPACYEWARAHPRHVTVEERT